MQATTLVFLALGASQKIPFCSGLTVPINLIKVSWINALTESTEVTAELGPMTRQHLTLMNVADIAEVKKLITPDLAGLPSLVNGDQHVSVYISAQAMSFDVWD